MTIHIDQLGRVVEAVAVKKETHFGTCGKCMYRYIEAVPDKGMLIGCRAERPIEKENIACQFLYYKEIDNE